MTFRFFIGGYFSGHFEVILRNEELNFFVSDCPMPIDYEKPTHFISIKDHIDWQNLIKYIANLKWKRKYESEILDGIQWELTFKSGHKKMNCYGSNAFPPDFGNLTALIKKFTTMHKIPDKLLGKFIM